MSITLNIILAIACLVLYRKYRRSLDMEAVWRETSNINVVEYRKVVARNDKLEEDLRQINAISRRGSS